MSTRLAFIGLGIMGHSMAGHLLNSGNSLVVHTRSKAKAEDLLARGAKWANSPAEATQQADVVFICVPDTPDVEAVVSGKNGILSAARKGLIVVDHSTISPSATRRMAQDVAQRGGQLLDAPVSGGDVGARNATLSIMVGGEARALEQVRGLLMLMGKTITHCGGSGTGQLTKLTNQVLVSLTNLAVCEALTFAQASGLDAAKAIEATGAGAAASWQLLNLGPKMIAGDFRPGFMIDLQQKDLRLVLEASEELGLNLQATQMVHRLFALAQAQGRGKEGTQALFAVVQQVSQGAK